MTPPQPKLVPSKDSLAFCTLTVHAPLPMLDFGIFVERDLALQSLVPIPTWHSQKMGSAVKEFAVEWKEMVGATGSELGMGGWTGRVQKSQCLVLIPRFLAVPNISLHSTAE